MEHRKSLGSSQRPSDTTYGVGQNDHDSLEDEARHHVLRQMNTLDRRPIKDLTKVPDGPGAYFLFRARTRSGKSSRGESTVIDELYAAFSTGRRAVYVGKTTTTGLRSRLAWHARGLEEAGLNLADIFFAAHPCATGAWATYLEAVVLETASSSAFPWNGSGFGSRAQGRRRHQRRSAFDCLHEGRFWVRTGATELDRAIAALEVAASGAYRVPEVLTWAPIYR